MKKLFTILTLALLSTLPSFAGPGDTIVVQTFEFEGYPVGSGWLSPRAGVFDFTSIEGKTFEKILAYYTLKCDPSQNPACGEWDYLSYLQLREHTYTGEHPNFKLYGYKAGTPDSVSYMDLPSWNYSARIESNIIYDTPANYDEYEIGNGTLTINNPFATENTDKRTMFLWRADELTNSGLTAGNISGMEFDLSAIGSKLNRLNIRIKNTSLSELSSEPDTTGFITVYSKNTEFVSTGWQKLDFTTSFIWDGTSNILVDFYFTSEENGTTHELKGNEQIWNCGIETSVDNNVNFNNHDLIHAPVENLSEITDQVTISFWLKGDTEVQPNNNSVFEARNAEGNRILNVHLPWSDQNIYWDAGNEEGYDRIQKTADYPGMYEGEWHHWVLIKNTVTDSMKIYFDGEVWHSDKWKYKELGSIDSLIIGKGMSNANGNYYAGNIDEFQIWDIELSETEILNWMHKEIDASHPNYSNLKLYYKFNEENQFSYFEEITGTFNNSQGVPQLSDFNGVRFKNFTNLNTRPNIKFDKHLSSYTISNELVIDSFPKGQDMILIYEQLVADEKPEIVDILYKWPLYYNNYVYDVNGNPTDSTFVQPDVTVYKNMFTYFTNDINEEITIPWELGRFITPYGNNLSLDDDGWTWIFDVTKFQDYLVGEDVYLKAGNFQELLDLKFLFIEGTPPRNFLDIEKVWNGNFQLSDFDNIVEAKVIPLNPSGEMFELHTTLTGHWFGQGNNCGEFCPNIHSVEVNGTEQFNWQIIQECGLNPLFPQGGTWFYDRAGWCPGMPATIQELDITPFIGTGDTEVELDYDIQYDPYGNYVTETFFVTYGDYNFTNDAAIDDIVAPNTFKLNSRFNPICGRPIIRIKNNGSAPLTSLNISYGINDQNPYNYAWTGNLTFGETEEVILPTLSFEEFQTSTTNNFTASISDPNGITDEYVYNNSKTSQFETVPIYNNQIVIHFKSNKRNWENSYEIIDNEGNVVHSKADFEYFTVHYDTLQLDYGCYEFVTYDTGGDGMYNWPSNYGTGYIKFFDTEGNQYITLEEWFGEEIRHQFVYSDYGVNIEEPKHNSDIVSIYPNPANDIINIRFNCKLTNTATIKIFNLTGKLNLEKQLNNINYIKNQQLDVSSLNNGIYFIHISIENGTIVKKLIIE